MGSTQNVSFVNTVLCALTAEVPYSPLPKRSIPRVWFWWTGTEGGGSQHDPRNECMIVAWRILNPHAHTPNPIPDTRYPKLQAVKNISDKIEAGQSK